MRCSGSPTTSIAVERSPRGDLDTSAIARTAGQIARREDATHEAAVRFRAFLFAAALKPMSKSLGFFGDVALDATALALAQHERLLGATFERMLR